MVIELAFQEGLSLQRGVGAAVERTNDGWYSGFIYGLCKRGGVSEAEPCPGPRP